MPTTIRASSYITTAASSGLSMTLALPSGTSVNDLLICATVNNTVGVLGPGSFAVLAFADIFGSGLCYGVFAKTMTSADIAAGSVTFTLGFPTSTQVWGVVATNGAATIRENPIKANFVGTGGSQAVTTSGAVLNTDTAVLFTGVVANKACTVTPGTTLATGASAASGLIGFDSSLSSGANTFTFGGGGTDANFQIAVILETGGGSPLAISCGNPPNGVIGSPYNHLFPASGGTSPYTFAIISGSLPPGLSLGSSSGTATGTPTTNGVFPFTVQVTDNVSATASVACSITIAAGGAWVIQEMEGELIPSKDPINGQGHFRYTGRCVNQAQAGTYLGFWESFGGGDGGTSSASSIGGGDLGNAPAGPTPGPEIIAHNGTVVAAQPELNFIDGVGTAITATNDATNSKVDVTIANAIGTVLLEAAGYTILAGDYGKLISFNDASPLTATLPATPPAAPWFVAIENIGVGVLTVARSGNTIDAVAANLTLNQNQGAMIFSNGAAYYTERGMGGGGTMVTLTLVEPPEFTVSGSPTSGPNPTITVGKATQAAATAWMGPVSGSAAQPTFRAIQTSDLPATGLALTLNKYVQNFSGVTSVTVAHNFGSTAVICQVYNSSGVKQDPESQTIIDANNIALTFGAAFTGSATVLGTTTRNSNTVFTASWTSQTSVTLTHNLGTLAVLVQVSNASGVEEEPETITLTSSNVVTLTFGAAFTGSVVIMASPTAVAQIGSYSTSWTAQTSVTVTHNLNTSNVAVMVTNGSGVEEDAETVTCTSANVVTLTFGGSFTGSVVVIG